MSIKGVKRAARRPGAEASIRLVQRRIWHADPPPPAPTPEADADPPTPTRTPVEPTALPPVGAHTVVVVE